MTVCTRCNGMKRIPCGFCYDGQTMLECMACDEYGNILLDDGSKMPCLRCKSTKKYYPPSCANCDNSAPCPDCNKPLQYELKP